MSNPLIERLNACGCCEVDDLELSIHNPPGQSALEYRIATWNTFLARMIARISRQEPPDGDFEGRRPLAALTTRATDDATIALFDAWAVVGDVLTFYQERIANENYLRTSVERRSVLQLARAIGYELSPGVSAEAWLSFTVDDAEGAPGAAEVAAGTQIQSVPAGEGETPQTFETSEDFTARVAWNTLVPLRSRPSALVYESWNIRLSGSTDALTHLHLSGTSLRISEGDLLLLVVRTGESSRAVRIETVRNTEEDTRAGTTRVDFQLDEPDAYTFDTKSPAEGTVTLETFTFDLDTVFNEIYGLEWEESDLQAFLDINGWDADQMLETIAVIRDSLDDVAHDEGVFVFRQRLGFFGHNAPRWESLPRASDTRGDAYTHAWDDANARSIWENSQGADHTDPVVYLERTVPALQEDSFVLFQVPHSGHIDRYAYYVTEVSEASVVDYAISGKTTALNLQNAASTSLTKISWLKTRLTTAFVESESLPLAPVPVTDPVDTDEIDDDTDDPRLEELDFQPGAMRVTLNDMVLGLAEGQPVSLTGERRDAEGVTATEIRTIKRVTHHEGLTTIWFEEELTYAYFRDTVTLSANVVHATHGETVSSEVLGSGDASVPHQAFTLRKPPLTHTSAATASGAEAALTVRVNNVAWEQVSSFYPVEAEESAFTVRIDNEANARIQFGDGVHGARLPTGQENVVATYRSGIGLDGEVGAGSLTMMKTRPFGARGVTNPLPASGAADPETLDDARDNAPLTVMTLDRIVSLDDFEHFTRAFSGIGKAAARALWSGESQLVFITVADADGDAVDETSKLYENLIDAIDGARDPSVPVRVESFDPLYFNLEARVLIDPDYLWADLEAAIEARILGAFSFEARGFGQPVTAAEVVTVIHEIDGVVAVDLEALHLVTETGAAVGPPLGAVLPSERARLDPATYEPLPAQLLLVNRTGITLTEVPT